jgi:hypothetical protein
LASDVDPSVVAKINALPTELERQRAYTRAEQRLAALRKICQ